MQKRVNTIVNDMMGSYWRDRVNLGQTYVENNRDIIDMLAEIQDIWNTRQG